MRVINSVESGGITYEAVWASMSWINNDPAGSAALALVVRTSDGQNETIIPRNAKLADLETSLRHLRSLGLKDSHLSELFNHRGSKDGLAKHIKVLVSSLR